MGWWMVGWWGVGLTTDNCFDVLLSMSSFFFFLFSVFLCSLRAKQIAHDQVMGEVKRQRDAHRDHKHAVICQQTQKNMLRRVVQQWKDNVNAIRGVTSVHSQHQAAQEQLLRMQERGRTQHQTIQKLRIELEASTKRNEMLEIIGGGA
jgi:hypothetical protein